MVPLLHKSILGFLQPEGITYVGEDEEKQEGDNGNDDKPKKKGFMTRMMAVTKAAVGALVTVVRRTSRLRCCDMYATR